MAGRNIGLALLVGATVMCGSGLQISVPLIAIAFFIAAAAVGISKRSTQFPKSTLAMLSTFDTVQMLLSMLAQPHVSGKMQSVLSKTSIPLNMGVQLMRGKKISSWQLIGASIVLAGAFAGILPGFLSSQGEAADGTNLVWCGVFLLSVVPAVLGVAYKETALKDSQIEENYLNAWTAFFQGVFSVLLLPLVMTLEGIPSDQLVPKASSGVQCLLGTNSSAIAEAVRDSVTAKDTVCPAAWKFVAVWLFFLFMFNATMTKLVANGGSTLMLATGLLITPVTNLAYSMPLLMGDHVEPISFANMAGLGLTVFGMVVYRISPAVEPASTTDAKLDADAQERKKKIEASVAQMLEDSDSEEEILDTKKTK